MNNWMTIEPGILEDHIEIDKPLQKWNRRLWKKMKNHKSPGQNRIAIENINYVGKEFKNKIFDLLKDIWKEGRMS